MPADNIGLVIIQDVRLSYPHLHKAQAQKSDDGSPGKEKFSAGFLIEKARADKLIGVHKGVKMPILKALKAAGDEARAAKWGDNPDKWPKLPPDRLYLRDGDIFKADKPEYVGHHFINSSANPENKPQVLTNRKHDGKWLPAQPGQPGDPYGGCFVTAILAIWAQDNQYGKRLNCEVKTVQFFRDGEAFSGGIVDPNELLTDDLAGIETGSLIENSAADDLI